MVCGIYPKRQPPVPTASVLILFLPMEAVMVFCPECESDLDLDVDQVDEGEIVSCLECGTDFEVVTTNPLELKAVSDEAEELEDESDNGDA